MAPSSGSWGANAPLTETCGTSAVPMRIRVRFPPAMRRPVRRSRPRSGLMTGGALAGGLTVLLSYSRVTTGAHHLSDVISGGALGVAVAVALRRIEAWRSG